MTQYRRSACLALCTNVHGSSSSGYPRQSLVVGARRHHNAHEVSHHELRYTWYDIRTFRCLYRKHNYILSNHTLHLKFVLIQSKRHFSVSQSIRSQTYRRFCTLETNFLAKSHFRLGRRVLHTKTGRSHVALQKLIHARQGAFKTHCRGHLLQTEERMALATIISGWGRCVGQENTSL